MTCHWAALELLSRVVCQAAIARTNSTHLHLATSNQGVLAPLASACKVAIAACSFLESDSIRAWETLHEPASQPGVIQHCPARG